MVGIRKRPARARVAAALAISLGAGLLGLVDTVSAEGASTQDVALVADGLPMVFGTQPATSPTGGGTAVRIYGEGFEGATSVVFEYYGDSDPRELLASADALDFEVVDGTLLTAVTPPSPGGDNVFVEIRVTDDEGTTPAEADWFFFYTDGSITVTPDSGLSWGDEVTVTADGYAPLHFVALGVVNPLAGFLENIPTFPGWPFGPPPYVALQFVPTLDTDADGDGTLVIPVPPLAFGPDPFRPQYDENSTCPPNQVTADAGLPRCFVTATQFSLGSLEYFITFVDNLVPADPTLTVTPSSAAVGDSVEVSGVNWNAAALFGSDSVPDDPGETPVIVEICDVALVSCSPAAGDAEVEMTRYFDNGPGVPSDDDPVEGVFTGVTLSGAVVVDDAAGCAPDCVLRVRQQRYDPQTMAPIPDEHIEATAALNLGGDACETPTGPVSGPLFERGIRTGNARFVKLARKICERGY